MWKETVSVTPPYHFDKVLERLSLDPLNAVDLHARSIKVPLRTRDGKLSVITVQGKAPPQTRSSSSAEKRTARR